MTLTHRTAGADLAAIREAFRAIIPAIGDDLRREGLEGTPERVADLYSELFQGLWQDPLAELVKIDPKSIGVGLYQHDVDQRALATALDRVVVSCVNFAGVNVNTASVQAYHPSAAILDYATTKGAIVAFTKGLAQHLIERGIRVNCVAPGPVWTPLVVASFHEEKNAQFGKGYPMERPAQPAELAPSYVFLASDESRYVVGEVLGVTGGKPLG